ncbi:MAG: 6-pyruvoyl tetrahydropterin synthase [Proteobacteria bacterium]|jgi:6-pyruvoyltetrahydropterin/6-carboxytetrahydropterin synthase|nr:6-pyruvoyl tetrahydropterin synthase [Pseudomonadota bacterium]
MSRLVSIEIEKQFMHFSAAHFTIFSATERERLHGHNYYLAVKITGEVDNNGLCFDYDLPKERLRDMCNRLDEYMLLPEFSPYLEIQDAGEQYRVLYDKVEMFFLKSDTQILPLKNITIEELSGYFCDQLCSDKAWLTELKIDSVDMKISSGPGQWAVSAWSTS